MQTMNLVHDISDDERFEMMGIRLALMLMTRALAIIKRDCKVWDRFDAEHSGMVGMFLKKRSHSDP